LVWLSDASSCIVQMASLCTCQFLHCAYGMGTGTAADGE
jgi:hypothetical protein